MPKKAPKNAFYFFMLNFKEEERKKGIQYENMAKVAEAAGPLWTAAPPPVRAKFEDLAKKEKQKKNIPEQKFTSLGVSFAEIERQEKEEKEGRDVEVQDIANIIIQKTINKAILHEDFYVIDVNYFCQAAGQYLIAETTVLRFNLTDGIRDKYHEIINPGKIPVGYAYDVRQGSLEIGLEMPDETKNKSNYFQILANIIDYLKDKDPTAKTMPPLFTMPSKVQAVQDFILQMCTQAAEDESIFRVYRLDTLFFTLINSIKSRSDEGFPKDSLALAQLKKDPFKYSPGLSCEIHEETDKAIECTTSRTKRWAFTVLDSCCPVVDIQMRAGSHVPGDYDLEGIINYKKQMREQQIGHMEPCSSRSVSEINEPMGSVVSGSQIDKKEPRKHEPSRMPKRSSSRVLGPPPELSETEFPSLAGHGRGRRLPESMQKMNLNK